MMTLPGAEQARNALGSARTVDAGFDVDTDAEIDVFDACFRELAATRCPVQRQVLAARLAAGLHKTMMLNESILYGSWLRSVAGSDGAPASGQPEILDREIVYRGYVTVEKLRIRLADQAVVTREVERHGDAVAVLPYDPRRRCALVARLFRAPVFAVNGAVHLEEACAGMIDGESEESAVRREAYEELGVRLQSLERVSRIWSSPGVSMERQSLFLAPYGLPDRSGSGGGLAREHEGILAVERPLADLARDADRGLIEDGKLLTLVMALRWRQPALFDGTALGAVTHGDGPGSPIP